MTDDDYEALLLATFQSDRTTWSADQVFTINNLRKNRLFFCPQMRRLRDRGATIVKACENNKNVVQISRKPLNNVSSGKPISLRHALNIGRTLESLSSHTDPDVRGIAAVGDENNVLQPFLLGEDFVIPSIDWVNGQQIAQFRTHYGLKRAELSSVIMGEGRFDKLLVWLEDGAKDKTGQYYFRITPYLADRIYTSLEALFYALENFKRVPFDVMPSRSQFFDRSHTAAGDDRTVALPLNNGNCLEPLTDAEKGQIERRALALAKSKLKTRTKKAAKAS